MTGTIHGKPCLHKTGLSCVEAYVEIKAGHKYVLVRFLNNSSETRVLHPGKNVAYLEMPDCSKLREDLSKIRNEENVEMKQYAHSVKESFVFDSESFDSDLLSSTDKKKSKHF